MAQEAVDTGQFRGSQACNDGPACVKSPVASLCLDCSSVRNRVRVTMSVLIFSWATGAASPFAAILNQCFRRLGQSRKAKDNNVSDRCNGGCVVLERRADCGGREQKAGRGRSSVVRRQLKVDGETKRWTNG